MNESSFVAKREPDWQRLAALCDIADSSPTALKPAELKEFVRHYRNVSADLATVRTQSTNVPMQIFLNDLVGRAYGILYRQRRKNILETLLETLIHAVRTVRRRRWFVLTSALLFFGTGMFLYGTLSARPDLRQSIIVDRGFEDDFKEWTSGNLPQRSSSESIAAWGMYASHNPLVAITAGSIAASTFGVGTVAMLMENGIEIGALSSEMMRVNKLGFLFASIFPHGVPEISGLVVSGAAGLCMGWALVNPGRKRRGEALLDAGKDAITLLGTSVVLMLIAAPIEGFFSFNPAIPSSTKVAVIVVELLAWGFFWTNFAKDPSEQPQPN